MLKRGIERTVAREPVEHEGGRIGTEEGDRSAEDTG